jgi:hypothetical protein
VQSGRFTFTLIAEAFKRRSRLAEISATFYLNGMEYLPLLIVPAIWVLIYYKRRTRPIDIPKQELVVEGTDREREEAEQALRQLPVNIREYLAMTHELLERFSTRHGYRSYYVEEIGSQLRQAGCGTEIVFQPGAIPGVADSLLEQQGHFELWVEKAQVENAREILQKAAIRPQQ